MAWNFEQRRRLAAEKKVLARYMPDFTFLDPTGGTYVEGRARTNSGWQYMTRIDLPERYPNSKPAVYIVDPRILPKFNPGETINDNAPSGSDHTIGTGHGGCVQLCQFGGWDPSTTCVKLLIKVHLWCEAYEAHLRTGREIAAFLPHE